MSTTLKEWKDELKKVQDHVKSVGYKGDNHPYTNQLAIINQNIADLSSKKNGAKSEDQAVDDAE